MAMVVIRRYGIDWQMSPATSRIINALLSIAAIHKHQALVLGALGCGAFDNPPYHVACLFYQVHFFQVHCAFCVAQFISPTVSRLN